MDSYQILNSLDSYFHKIMQHGFPPEGFHFPVDPEKIEDEELKDFCLRASELFEMIDESCRFSGSLAEGNLQVKASRNNLFTMSLKELQSSLAHLTWQVDQVAKGDLNQQVSFLGDFSRAFNNMIDSLREKQILEQRVKVISEVLGEGLLLIDNSGKILFANPEALKLLKYSFKELESLPLSELFQDSSPEKKLLKKSIAEGLNYNEYNGLLNCKSGKKIPVMISVRPVLKDEKLDATVITFRDITEQKKYLQSLETINKLLEKQAKTDALTGICNRMKFDEILAKEIQRTKRNKFPLSLILCDIDHFKQINDRFGHQAGDQVLKRLTRLVTKNIRSIDYFARWGGEEFVILSPGTDTRGAALLAEKIRRKVENHSFTEPGNLTLSFGVTSFRTGDSAGKLINRADEAMYRAKENGRNQVQISD